MSRRQTSPHACEDAAFVDAAAREDATENLHAPTWRRAMSSGAARAASSTAVEADVCEQPVDQVIEQILRENAVLRRIVPSGGGCAPTQLLQDLHREEVRASLARAQRSSAPIPSLDAGTHSTDRDSEGDPENEPTPCDLLSLHIPKKRRRVVRVSKFHGLREYDCRICLNEISRTLVSVCLPCCHRFCFPCIRRWVATRASKPVCALCNEEISHILYAIRDAASYKVRQLTSDDDDEFLSPSKQDKGAVTHT